MEIKGHLAMLLLTCLLLLAGGCASNSDGQAAPVSGGPMGGEQATPTRRGWQCNSVPEPLRRENSR